MARQRGNIGRKTEAIGVLAIAGGMVFATSNQQNYIAEDSVPAHANLEGSFSSPSGLGAELNKEKWHSDPFADEAAAVKAKAGLQACTTFFFIFKTKTTYFINLK